MDLKKHIIRLQGKDYLPVAARIVAFREQHPAGAISTDLVTMEPRIVVRASVHSTDGVVLATGYGTAPISGKGTWQSREIEKAETAAIGRALAHAGFGTLYATDADDDTDNLADSPVEPPRKPAPAPEPAPTPTDWTRQQAESLVAEANNNGVATDELLTVLGVPKISEFTPGFSAAREQLRAYLKARPAPATEQKEVIF